MDSKSLFILMSHNITQAQKEDAQKLWGVDCFRVVPAKWWSQIPADADNVCDYVEDIKVFLRREAKEGDILLVQGDFGATVNLVTFAESAGLIPIYATTERVAKELVDGDKITTTREFKHVRFRHYETGFGNLAVIRESAITIDNRSYKCPQQ